MLNFFKAVDKTLWAKDNKESFIRKTIGVQALFDLLRKILEDSTKTQTYDSSRLGGRME